jgi:hypothetical protein
MLVQFNLSARIKIIKSEVTYICINCCISCISLRHRRQRGYIFGFEICAYCGVPLKAGISESERPSIARQRFDNQVSCVIVWVTNTFRRHRIHRQPVVRRCESTEVFSWTDKLNPPRRCSVFSRQRILLRGWLTQLTDSEGSDIEMSDSEEDARWKRSRTVRSEVYLL